MDDLIRDLKWMAGNPSICGPTHSQIAKRGADRIEALEAKNAALRDAATSAFAALDAAQYPAIVHKLRVVLDGQENPVQDQDWVTSLLRWTGDDLMLGAFIPRKLTMSMDLTIPLNGIYFDQIKAGTKTEEYRLVTPFWSKRLVGRTYDQVILTRGYPKAGDIARRLSKPYRGYVVKTITHPHFGGDPVEVFAINVE